MRIIQVVVLLLLAGLCTTHGQAEFHDHDELLAKAFRDGPGKEAVNDPYQVLRHNPELAAELTQAIDTLEKKYQFRIRVLIRPVWMGGTVQELAGTLQDVWFPKGDGLVMIIETDNRKLGLGVSMHGDPEDKTWIMPTHASADILKSVADRMNRDLPLDEFLRSVVLDMVSEHDAFLAKRMADPEPAHVLREYLFLLGALAVAGLGAFMVAAWVRLSHAKEHDSVRRFPAVAVPERLGAPFGGGTIATRKFDHRQP
jgi:hypothetical protein